MAIIIVNLILVTIFFVLVSSYIFPDFYFNLSLMFARKNANLEIKEVYIEGKRVVYLDSGGDGENLILLHGFGADKYNWMLVAPLLKNKFRLIIPDIPGFGESEYADNLSYNLDAQVNRLEFFIEAIGCKQYHIGGNSMGGLLAAMIAKRNYRKIFSMWLLAPAGVLTTKDAMAVELIKRKDNPFIIRTKQDFKRLIGLCFERKPITPFFVRRVYLSKARDRADINTKLFEELTSALIEEDQQVFRLQSQLDNLNVPTLIQWGDKDQILHPSGLTELTKVLKFSEGTLLKNMGHIPMLERPKEAVIGYMDFLKKRVSGGGN